MFNLIPWGKKTSKDDERMLTAAKSHPPASLQEEFDTMFDRFLNRWPFPWSEGLTPRSWDLDLEEREEELVVKAEVPGFEPEEIDVQISGQMLTIKAEKKHERKTNGKENVYEERSYRCYHQSVQLPVGAKPDQVDAKYRNGILELHIPRSEETRLKRIPVKA